MRKVLIPLGVVALAIAAAAVGGRGEVAAAAPASCAKANLDLVKDGQLSIGTDNPAYPPWFAGGETKGRPWKINDPAKGQGFEPAVAYAVAKRLGFAKNEVVWVYSPFNKTIAPGTKAFDFAINQVSYTPQRAKALGFSAGYYYVNQSIVGVKGKPISSVRSIAGLKALPPRRAARDDELPVHRRHDQAEPVGRGLRHERRGGGGAQERPDRRPRRRPADRVLRHRGAGAEREDHRPVPGEVGRRSASGWSSRRATR